MLTQGGFHGLYCSFREPITAGYIGGDKPLVYTPLSTEFLEVILETTAIVTDNFSGHSVS